MRRLPPFVSGARPVVGHAVEFLNHPVPLLERGRAEHGLSFSLRFGRQPAVVLLGEEGSRLVFAETDRRLSMRAAYPYFMRMFDPDFYFMADVEEYRRQREIVLPRFQSRQLAGYLQAMAQETVAFEQLLGDAGEFDLVSELGPLVMRIAALCFLGRDFGERLRADYFAEFRRFSGGIDPVLPGWLPIPRLVGSRRARDRLRRTLADLIHRRRTRPIDPPDFLQVLVESRYSDGQPVPDRVLVNLILLLTWAGHETTTGHLAWAVIDLLQHPDELARVLDEQHDVLPESCQLDLKLIRRLARLDRALHETERLHPVVHMIVRISTEPIEYGDYLLPPRTRVLASPASSHRLPGLFEHPDDYRPDRYLNDPGALQKLIGFGGGHHRCLGQHFAYLEMKVILTRLLRRYELQLLDPDPTPVTGPKAQWPASPCRVRYRTRIPAPSP
jgi:sterol 14-demethylase